MFSNIVSGAISTLYNINGCRSINSFLWLAEYQILDNMREIIISAFRWYAGDY